MLFVFRLSNNYTLHSKFTVYNVHVYCLISERTGRSPGIPPPSPAIGQSHITKIRGENTQRIKSTITDLYFYWNSNISIDTAGATKQDRQLPL